MAILEQPLHLKSAYLEFSGDQTPDVAPAGMARVYYDKAANLVKFSANGGAFSGTPNALSLQDLTAHVLTTVPTASAAAAVLRLDTGTGGTAFAGNANGTMLGINLATGSADLLSLQKAGVNRFVVSETGIATGLKSVFGGGTTSLGTATIHQTNATTIAEVIRAAASASVNQLEIQSTDGVARVSVGSLTDVAHPTLVLRAITSQTANLQQWRNSADGVLASIAVSGLLFVPGFSTGSTASAINGSGLGGVNFAIFSGGDAVIPAVIRATASQTSSLQEWQTSAGVVLSRIGPAGRVFAKTPNSAAADGDLVASQTTFYLNEAGNLLVFKCKYADGTTVRTGSIALT